MNKTIKNLVLSVICTATTLLFMFVFLEYIAIAVGILGMMFVFIMITLTVYAIISSDKNLDELEALLKGFRFSIPSGIDFIQIKDRMSKAELDETKHITVYDLINMSKDKREEILAEIATEAAKEDFEEI